MKQIYKLLEEYLTDKNINDVSLEVRINKDKESGDFHTNLSFKLINILKKSPYDIGINIKDYIQPKIDNNYKVEVSSNGYINFYKTSNNYIDILGEIQKIDFEFNIKNIISTNDTKEIIYIYNRLSNIINVLSLDKIYSDINNFDISSLDEEAKKILDKSINIYEGIKYNKEVNTLVIELNELVKFILKYEETNIIRYLNKDELFNFIILANTINILIKNILSNIGDYYTKRM